jgi:peptidoglycan LD-endopeptidase CwlK
MTLDAVSENNLLGVAPAVIACVRRAADILAPDAVYFRVYSGLRTAAQQDADYRQGRYPEFPGKVITNARAGQSSHNYGLAVDAVPFSHGETGLLDWTPTDPEFKTFVAAMKRAGLNWGGDWLHFKDMDHFYLGPDNPTPAMRAAYGSGSLEELVAIWDTVGASAIKA